MVQRHNLAVNYALDQCFYKKVNEKREEYQEFYRNLKCTFYKTDM